MDQKTFNTLVKEKYNKPLSGSTCKLYAKKISHISKTSEFECTAQSFVETQEKSLNISTKHSRMVLSSPA